MAFIPFAARPKYRVLYGSIPSPRISHSLKIVRFILFVTGLVMLVAPVSGAASADSGVAVRDFAVRTWGRSAGLPSDSVTTILQTSDGYLWVGTAAGLVRFDGHTFTPISLPAINTNAPIRITALCEGKSGELWVGTQQEGLMCFDATGLKYFRRGRELLDDNITSLATDSDGRLWIGTRSGLNRWDGSRFTAFTSREGLADEFVSGIHVARSGAVWITTRSGMYQHQGGRIIPYEFQTESQGRSPEFIGAYEDRRGNLWAFGDTYLINLAEGKRFNYFRGADAASVRIWSLCEGRDGRLWIGTSGRGLFCFGENKFQPVTLSAFHSPNDVRAICEDREGSLWLGTASGGLVQLLPRPVQVLKADQGLPPGLANSLATDAAGRIYVGFESGALFAGGAGRFDPVAGGAGMEGRGFITSLCAGSDQTLWIATLGNGLISVRNGRAMNFTTLNGLADNAVLTLCATPEGALWAGTRAGALHQITNGAVATFTKKHGLSGSAITVLLSRRTGPGGLWLGTEDGEFLQGDAGRFSVVDEVGPAPGHSIAALHEDAKGRVWIGTAGAGLACWTGQRTARWTAQNGLPDDGVQGVVEDAEGDLWLATASGIYRVSRDDVQEALAKAARLRCQLMFETESSSAKPANFGGPRAVRSPDGHLWFATTEGVLTVDTRTQDAANTPLPVYIENILVNGEPLQPAAQRAVPSLSQRGSRPVKLPATLRSIEFQFAALSLFSPEKLRFRHKLEGFDPDWVDAAERRATYSRLPYGDYRFRVAASQRDGLWSEAASPFVFQVPTPLWRAPEAIAAYILLTVGAVAGIVRLISHRRLRRHLARLEQQQALERERMRIAQDMHDDIGSKLTKISFLSERAKVESSVGKPVARQIESIASTSRELLQTLDEIVWAVNPHNDTLEHLAAYLAQYASEYFLNTAVECELRLPRQMPEHPVSAEARHNLFLAFEEALNNVLKHAGAAKVRVEMIVNSARFEIVIADDGAGFELTAGPASKSEPVANGKRGGNGLVNMRQRLADVGGFCDIRSKRGQGTTVSLRIPLNSPALLTQ